jgi:hypothetical protein
LTTDLESRNWKADGLDHPVYILYRGSKARQLSIASAIRQRATMSSTDRYDLDPSRTPGYCHVEGLTKESAHVANLILQSNRTAYHVFTTDFDKMGVR